MNKHNMRADWRAIRLLYKKAGAAAARAWSEIPLIDTTELLSLIPNDETSIPVPDLERIPLCPCVILLDGDEIDFACSIARQPIDSGEKIWAFMTIPMLEKNDFEHVRFPWITVLVESTNNGVTYRHSKEHENEEYYIKAAEDCTNRALLVLRTLEEYNKHVVEVEHSVKQNMKKHTNTKKPWTRTDLRSAILIDFNEAKKYGHCVNHGDTHASPTPHVRRGNFATLRAKRFGKNIGKRVWRKQAWVGDAEWIFEGRRYKVVGV